MKKIHLICNAHLDPVFLWKVDDGVAEALSTFRIAADFCEEYDGFVFNHNEVILYEWIEHYEPELFIRIKRLVVAGKWHIMGGWYLQPDCNMPSGEGLIRQIEVGRKYFKEKFDAEPTTAINFDSFGHCKGLVQILKKTGFDSYLFCRPLRKFDDKVLNEWGFDDFIWKGFDDSEIIGHKHFDIYMSLKGHAVKKINEYLDLRNDREIGLVLWGIGNHGGGPSKIDMDNISELMTETKDIEIIHSTPEDYFDEINTDNLPVIDTDLNPWAVGSYTTLSEIKRKYRMLESELFLVEKMVSHASLAGTMEYPHQKINEAQKDMLYSQFHDIIPGTIVPSALEESLNTLSHGLDILRELKTEAFIKLAAGQKKAEENEIPIIIYNPHPYEVEGIFECEFHMIGQYPVEGVFYNPVVIQDGTRLPSQYEHQECHMPIQWRRKVVFQAKLNASSMNRFDCVIEQLESRSMNYLKEKNNKYYFENGDITFVINCNTGLVDKLVIKRKELIDKNCFNPIIIDDDDHTIGTFIYNYRDVIGCFEPMTINESTAFAGVTGRLLKPTRVVEDGEARTVIESDLKYNNSRICMRYYLPKKGAEIHLKVIVHWNENKKMLKLQIPTSSKNTKYIGQVAFGKQELYNNGDETVSQKWVGVINEHGGSCLTIANNRIYGSDFKNGELRLSLLRSPRFGCLTQRSDSKLLYNDGYVKHSDQGVREFDFWINGGQMDEILAEVDYRSNIKHEAPYVLSFFPSGQGRKSDELINLDNIAINLSCFKQLENGNYLFRLFNTQDDEQNVSLKVAMFDIHMSIKLGKFEVKTYVINSEDRSIKETDMLGNDLVEKHTTLN